MKNFKISTIVTIVVVALTIIFSSCEAGLTSKTLNGDEENLPNELKGLKVYRVWVEGGNYVQVAVLDDKVNSTTYQVGKTTESTVIINRQNGKLIQISQILVENDSVIVCRK